METGRKFSQKTDPYLLEAILLFLLAVLYLPLIARWYEGWLSKSISLEHEYFSHGLIGLPFAGYLIWQNRDIWRKLDDRSHPLGAALLAIAGLFYFQPLPDLVHLSLPICLAGLCLWLKGMPGLRLQTFPLIFVLFATPNDIPYLIAPYTLPLQSFIAATAAGILDIIGIDVTLNQIYLYVGGRTVEVAPHCAGLKMLFTTFYVGTMLICWTGLWRSRARTIFLLGNAALISVIANIFRNTLLTFFHGTGRDGLFHWLHESWGGDLYSACMLGSLFLLVWALERFFPMQPSQPAARHAKLAKAAPIEADGDRDSVLATEKPMESVTASPTETVSSISSSANSNIDSGTEPIAENSQENDEENRNEASGDRPA